MTVPKYYEVHRYAINGPYELKSDSKSFKKLFVFLNILFHFFEAMQKIDTPKGNVKCLNT
jgi:hypothetical protein